jgi:hypothetical protein
MILMYLVFSPHNLHFAQNLVLTQDNRYILMVGNPIVMVTSRGLQIRDNFMNKQTGAQSIAVRG